jgi:hypothetical protein
MCSSGCPRESRRRFARSSAPSSGCATTVRVENGQALLTDGPFVDAKEHVGGFCLVEADDLDGALEIAARIPVARLGGAIEVRSLAER